MKFGHGGQIKDDVAFYMNIDGVWVAGTPVRKGDNCVQGFVAVSSTHVVRLSFNVVKLTGSSPDLSQPCVTFSDEVLRSQCPPFYTSPRGNRHCRGSRLPNKNRKQTIPTRTTALP